MSRAFKSLVDGPSVAPDAVPPDQVRSSSLGVAAIAAIAVVLAIVNVALTLVVLDRTGNLHHPQIVSVDAADLIRGFVEAQPAGLSDDALQSQIRTLNANLDMIIATYAADRGVLVVNAAAVLGGARDITPDLLHHIGVRP